MDFMKLPFDVACAVCDNPAKVIATEWEPQDGIPLCSKCKRKYQHKTIQDIKDAIGARQE
jgi:hypothetical protein